LVQIVTAETTGSARSGSVSHSTRCPSSVLTAPSVGASNHRQSTAIASGALIHGSTYNVRKNPLPGSPGASMAAAMRPSTDWVGTTITMNSAVTTSDVANDESVSTERQLSSPTY
jgi:hypothetical protein